MISEYKNSITPCTFDCENCGHQWDAAAAYVLGGGGCQNCYGNLKFTIDQLQAKFFERGFELLGTVINGVHNTRQNILAVAISGIQKQIISFVAVVVQFVIIMVSNRKMLK